MHVLSTLRCRIGLCLLAGLFPLLAQPTAQAIAGDPFGVCLVSDPAGTGQAGLNSVADFEEALLEPIPEAKGRALYPVTLGPGSAAFLFQGDQPLELAGGLRVPVLRDETAHQALLQTWWKAYARQAQGVVAKDLYEPIAETYLTAMLARRLAVDASELKFWRPWKSGSVDDVVGLLLGTESIRLAMQRHTMLENGQRQEKADQPLPAAATPPVLPVPAFDAAKVVVEPIAFRVPQECFYLRSSDFANFLWLRGLLDQWGGEFRNLVATRGADYQLRARLERQLALRETALSRQFGSLAVGDVALIGTDTFFREGAAVGVLFHAKRSPLLTGQLTALRRQVLAEDPSVISESVRIGGRECSLLSRPDNTVRSFYVVDGEFHLVTNSRWIVEGFLKTAQNRAASLGGLKEFRYARSRVPVARKDPAFLYLSDPFFRNLVGPTYRVEMTRRAQSLAELSVASLARLAASAEGSQGPALAQLIQGGFLPAGFGTRVDGTSLTLREGQYVDSLRGGRGTFLPVPDVAIVGLTASEVEAYRQFTRNYARLWTNVDPVFGAITRASVAKGREGVALELHISPYAKARYGLLENVLGRVSPWRMSDIQGNLLSAEAILKDRPDAAGDAAAPPATNPRDLHRLFGGLRDFSIPTRILQGEIVPDRTWQKIFETNLRGYLGQYKPVKGGLTDFLFRGLEGKPDAGGYIRHREAGGAGVAVGLWTRIFGDFVVTGLDRKALEEATPQMKLQKGERTAQVRLALGDLGQSRLGTFLTAHLYTRDRRTSAANALLLEHLTRQFHLAPQAALATAETLLDQRITCPLGGRYVLTPGQRWISTAWQEERLRLVDRVPAGYRHPGLDWLHGAALEFSINPQSLQTRLELLIDPGAHPLGASLKQD